MISEKRKRSRGYPGYGLQECVQWTKMIASELGSGPHSREHIAKALGSTGLTGAATRKIAALAQFGLLQREPGGFALTALSDRVTRPVNERESNEAIGEAFHNPELYREVLERFSGDGRIPSMLSNILVRSHEIEASASKDAARIFLASGRFAGVISEDGRLVETSSNADERQDEDAAPMVLAAEAPMLCQRDIALDEADELLQDMRSYIYPLTQGRTAKLVVPAELIEKDIRLLMMQMQFLGLAAGVEISVKITSGEESSESALERSQQRHIEHPAPITNTNQSS